MVFTSFVFLKFFTLVFIGLWLTRNRTQRQLLILVSSAIFYAYWKPIYLLLLLTPSMIDYWCSIHIEDTDNPRRRRAWLLVSLITNLGLLAYFKYTNFFIDNIALLLGRRIPYLDIVLPVGISFYTFKTLSYTIDVYRGHIPACRSLWKYAMFVTYFPELVAGPIVRASIFLPQMNRSLRPSWSRTFLGLQLVLLGVTKKLVVADRMADLVDPIFAHPAAYTPFTVISAVVAYSLQIYCDFSGYSDIAIGISKIIGYDLPENFNMPYAATSLVDFWRRWHMTLSAWLRDYLYIPLGGNRHGRLKTYRNLMITMLLGGLWHGASWNFVFWGLLHGCGLAVNHWWTRDRQHAAALRPPNPLIYRLKMIGQWLATYLFVCFAWIFFRSRNLDTSLVIVRKVLYLDTSGSPWFYSPLYMLLAIVILAHILGAMAARQGALAGSAAVRWIVPPEWAAPLYAFCRQRFAVKPSKVAGIYVLMPLPGFAGGFIVTLWLIGVYLFASLKTAPFIYFQF